MSFRRRTFPEVLESLLTSTTGGVAAESHPFPPPGSPTPPFSSPLQQPPAAALVSVWGSRDGQPHAFRTGVDVLLSDDGRSLVWPAAGAEYPDPGTLVTVNYRPAGAQAGLTDVAVGSVVRTLMESTALEVGRLYAMLEAVYDAGFVDTAAGSALDNVVALLGIERVRGGRPTGTVELSRASGSFGEITIPAGMRVATADGRVQYETVDGITMAPAQSSVRVAVRDLEPNDPLPADSLTLLPVPIAGIGAVRNPAPTALSTQDETDEELRTRAKNFLHGSERATRAALEQAIRGQGITADVQEDAAAGVVRITPHAETLPPDLLQRLESSIARVRPVGVRVELAPAQAPRKVNLELRLTTAAGLVPQDLRAAQRAVREKVADYFARLPASSPASVNQLVGLVLSVPAVEDVQLVTATWTADGGPAEDVLDLGAGQLAIRDAPTVLGELHIADPNLPTLLNVAVSYPQAEQPPDPTQLRAKLAEALSALNAANESDGGGALTLPFGQLLLATPLPNRAPEPVIPAPPTLPSEDEALPYVVRYVFTLETGLSQILDDAGDSYTLTPYERLSLGDVQVAEVGGG